MPSKTAPTTDEGDLGLIDEDGGTRKSDMADQDLRDMAEQGKRQQFNRNFSFMSMLGFATTMMCTWEAVFFANATAMLDGGGPTLIYGFLFSWIGSLATACSLAELTSMAPTSGGQYHWVYMLAPDNCKVFLSWFTGWVSTIGWNANTAAGIFFSGTITQGLLVLNYTDYVPQRWQGTLLMFAALAIVIFVNTLAARLLPKVEGLILIIHTLGFFAIVIPLVYLSDHNPPSVVFVDFVNSGGWNSNGLAFFVGIISTNLPFIGYDGPCHMAEEVKNASTIVPWAMMCTVLLNGTLGFAVCIVFAFCITNPQEALHSTTGYDFIEVFYAATASRGGTSVMSAILIALVTCAAFGFLASSSRQTWAFARDRGLPFPGFLSYVSKRTALPLRAVFFCATITALICLLNIASTVAFNAIVSITIGGLFTSYLIPIALVASKRATGASIRWGPWRLGKFGLAVNVVSIIYLMISIVFSFFPPALPLTLKTMNWSCVVWGVLVLAGLVYYAVAGRKAYSGPIIERPILASEFEDYGKQ